MLTTLAGVALAAWLFRSAGLSNVAAAAGRIGWSGFILYCLYSLGVFWLLGAAWLAAAPGEPATRLPLFTWARLVRESVADLLPFAQIGGLVIGARVTTAAGVPSPRVYASMIVDLTTEMSSQLVFTLLGLATMATILLGEGGATLRPLAVGGTLSMLATALLFYVGQRWALTLARGVTERMLPTVSTLVGAVEIELARIYADRRRVALATLANLAAWIASAAGAWLALVLMGQSVGLGAVLSIESLVFTARSIAFVVPAAIGVQEAAYAIVMPLFGLAPEIGLALSLVKRARELAIGIPTLLAWQTGELRAVARLS